MVTDREPPALVVGPTVARTRRNALFRNGKWLEEQRWGFTP